MTRIHKCSCGSKGIYIKHNYVYWIICANNHCLRWSNSDKSKYHVTKKWNKQVK